MTTKVFDIAGTERDLAWLSQAWDGCEVLPARITAGATEYWKLVAVYCTTGPANLKAEVRRDATTPADGQPVVATWPNLTQPSQDIDTLPINPHNWAVRGVIQRTEGNGITGFGLGGGKKHDEEEREVEEVETYGPWYSMWVFSSVPSDLLHNAGMKGGTNHDGPLHGVWILTPVAPTYATLREALLAGAAAHWVMPLNPNASLQRTIFATGGVGFVPTTAEFDVSHGGVDYVAQACEHLGTHEVRIYFCPKSNYNFIGFEVR